VFSAVAVLWFHAAGRRRDAMTLAIVAGAIVLENGFKYAIHRARPEAFFGVVPESFSFPSGHACFAVLLRDARRFARGPVAEAGRSRGGLGRGGIADPGNISRIYLGGPLSLRCHRRIPRSRLLDQRVLLGRAIWSDRILTSAAQPPWDVPGESRAVPAEHFYRGTAARVYAPVSEAAAPSGAVAGWIGRPNGWPSRGWGRVWTPSTRIMRKTHVGSTVGVA
jgi:hypothetical protein